MFNTIVRVRLIFRVIVPFIVFFLLPRLVGPDIYAAYIVLFFFFTSAIGLVTSPLEHTLIRMSSKPGYVTKFIQIFWGYLGIAVIVSFVAVIVFIFLPITAQIPSGTLRLLVLLAVAFTALICQLGYFLKFLCSDWYYYYAEIVNNVFLVALIIISEFWVRIDLMIFSLISLVVYLGLVAVRLLQIFKKISIIRPRPMRIILLIYRSFCATTISSLIGALVKRADSFYMPVMNFSPIAVLIFRLVRNVITSVTLVGNIHAQDIWMTKRMSKQKSSFAFFLIVTIFILITLVSIIWLYIEWLRISNPLRLNDLWCIGLSTMAAVYLSLNSVEINRVYQEGRYDIIFKGSLISLISLLLLIVAGKLNQLNVVTYLLILVFIPQLTNGLYIIRKNDITT